jgi:hypothetical protein
VVKRSVVSILTLAVLLVGLGEARAQGAGDALDKVLVGAADFEGAFSSDTAAVLRTVLLTQTATFPIGSSAGGFAWTFDPTMGVATRRTQSFGPMFAERPFTTGKGKVNVGVAFQTTKLKSVSGEPLSDLRSTYDDGFFSDVFRSELDLSVTRTVLSMSFGVSDRVDLGFVVPFGRVKVAGTSEYQFRIDGDLFDSERNESEGSSTGIGDIILRGKAAIPSPSTLDLAAAVDFRLPTGDSKKLLGVGTMQVKTMIMASATRGPVSPHVNLGYTFGGKGIQFEEDEFGQFLSSESAAKSEPSPEFSYTVGADVVASPKVTISGDVIGRSLRRSAEIVVIKDEFGQYFEVRPATVNLLIGAIGVKVNMMGSWLLAGSVLFPLNDKGVKPGITPVIGFERAF